MNSRKDKDIFYTFRYIRDLKDMLASSAELFAGRTAYLVKDRPGDRYRPVTYRQVKEDVDALGTRLMDLGLAGKKIAIIGENSYSWVAAYLAVTNGTGVIVPLDRELPPPEIANLLRRAEVSAVIYSYKMEKKLALALAEMETMPLKICIGAEAHCQQAWPFDRLVNEGRSLLRKGDRRFVDAEIDREAMCTLLFTSGTTGLAKGVMLSHKNITANVYNMSKYVKIPVPGTGLSVLPMHHSYEMTCHIFTGLYQGMCIAMCDGLRYIQKNMKEVQATVMLGVPLLFESMHRKIWKQAESAGRGEAVARMLRASRKLRLYHNRKLIRRIFSPVHESLGDHMKLFISGGAAIDPEVIRNYEAMGIPMIQGYGMTENAPIIAVNRDRYSKADSVGRPVPGTEVRILDPDGEGIGEIICRGPSVMLGYYNDPEATEEVLRNGWLHTGDYGRFDEDGFLYICGRKKNIIVTKNGKNIFPEEVEHYLLHSPYIAEVVVSGTLDERTGDVVVKAEIFPDLEAAGAAGQGETGGEQLRALLKEAIDRANEQMPAYKRVKRFIIRYEEFEKTSTQKIKRYNRVLIK